MTVKSRSKKEDFFNILRDVFCGKVKDIEGQSATVKLMRIKNKYYQHIEKHIEDELNNIVSKYPDFEKELYDKLYNFFHKYFTESGILTFASTPFHNNVYEKIYTNENDVVLFWKTRDLYYIKTEKVFRSMEFDYKDYHFYFDASKVEGKRGNEKRHVIFSLKQAEGKKIVFEVQYKEGNKDTKSDEILKELKKKGISLTEEDLYEVFNLYNRQADIDFFLHKRPREFLREQFNLWLYQYLSEDHEWDLERINQFNLLRRVAFKIIDFIAQFEEELVKIWLKPRFVLNSNYVITLDRIANKEGGIEIISRILNHPNIKEQIQEWRDLNIVDENFKPEEILQENSLNEKYKFLPIDTKYFKDLEVDILSLFDNLDDELDGWLIKSENFQALNTILPKFKGKVQTIYIDPPFNKEQDADYLYTVKYKDSTWATMLENRISLARDLLNDKGSIFVRCDYNGNWIVRPLMDEIFGRENFRNEIVCMRVKKQTAEKAKAFAVDYDNLYFYSKSLNLLYVPKIEKTKNERKEWHSADTQGKYEPKVFFGKELYPPTPRRGWFSQRKIDELISKKELRLVCKACGYEHYEGELNTDPCPVCKSDEWRVEYKIKRVEFSFVGNLWNDISGYTHSNWEFSTKNSEKLLKRVIETTSNEGDLVMDFFLGSGTTIAVAHKLKRKWIGIEMGEHFYSVVLPRMKKVLAYDKSEISTEKDVKEKYNEKNAGGFFKYCQLEQFEDILSACKYDEKCENEKQVENSIFMFDKKLLSCVNTEEDKVKVSFEKIYSNADIDWIDSISLSNGLPIREIRQDYVLFGNDMKIKKDDIDINLVKNLIFWE